MVALMTQVAYGLPRYLLPAGMVACVLAGVGVARIGEFVGERVKGPRIKGVSVSGAVAVLAVCALTLPWSIDRVSNLVLQSGQANQAAYYQDRLFTLVDRLGGRQVILPCRTSGAAINHTIGSALAWKLQVPERRIHGTMHGTGYVFQAPKTRNTGPPPKIAHRPRAIRRS